jgi:hypothetical protein
VTTTDTQVTCPVRLLSRGDHITINDRTVEVTGNHPQRRLGDERREFARTYELCWMDVETWHNDGATFPADLEFPFIRSAAEILETTP